MSKKWWMSSKVNCPYYKHENTQVVYCDGVDDCSVIHLAFANRKEAKDYKDNTCKTNYDKCLIFKMLQEKENTDASSNTQMQRMS